MQVWRARTGTTITPLIDDVFIIITLTWKINDSRVCGSVVISFDFYVNGAEAETDTVFLDLRSRLPAL